MFGLWVHLSYFIYHMCMRQCVILTYNTHSVSLMWICKVTIARKLLNKPVKRTIFSSEMVVECEIKYRLPQNFTYVKYLRTLSLFLRCCQDDAYLILKCMFSFIINKVPMSLCWGHCFSFLFKSSRSQKVRGSLQWAEMYT